MHRLYDFVETRSTKLAIFGVLVLYVAIFCSREAFADSVAYGAYGHYPVGSTRVLAMGGAFVGLADDGSTVVTNPAGLSMMNEKFSIGGGDNRIVNKEATFGSGTQEVAPPYTSLYRSLGARIGWLGVGFAYSNPYQVDYQQSINGYGHQILEVESYDAAIAISFFKKLSLGVTARSERVRVGYIGVDGRPIQSKADGIYPLVGALFEFDQKARLGFSYSPERRYNIDESLESQLPPTVAIDWFHDVVIPAKATLGLSAKIRERLRGVGDIDIFMPVKNAIFVGALSSNRNAAILEQQQTVIHGGFEFSVLKEKNLEFNWRGGGYNEPHRLATSKDRLHFTMGVEFRFWCITVAAAYDQAQDFSNLSQSIGISLGAI